MNGKLVGMVLMAFAATTALAAPPRGHSGGGHAARARARTGHASGDRASGARSSGRRAAVPGVFRGHAVHRGVPRVGRPGPGSSYAERRHPRPGYGSGARYRGRGRGYYGRGYRGFGPSAYHRYSPYHRYYPSYGYYPYYDYYPYYGYYYPEFSLGLYYGNGYGSYAPYAAPYYVPYGDGPYPDDGSYAAEAPPEDEGGSGQDSAGEEAATGDTGEVQLDVQPGDASVYVDDQFFGIARQLETLRLPPGPHRIEVVRPGFRTEERTVEVALDAAVPLSIELVQP